MVVWYDGFRGVRTTKSCATAAIVPRTTKIVQPGVCVLSRESSGSAIAVVIAARTKK